MADTGEGPTLILDQTEARRAKNFWETGSLSISKDPDDRPPPPPPYLLIIINYVVNILVNIRKLINRGYYGL